MAAASNAVIICGLPRYRRNC